MSSNWPSDNFLEIVAELSSRAFDGNINEEQFYQMKEVLNQNKAARDFYFKLLNLHAILSDADSSLFWGDECPHYIYDKDLWAALKTHEDIEPAIEMPVQKKPEKPVHKLSRLEYPTKKPIKKSSIVTLISVLAASLFLIILARIEPVKIGIEVATLYDSVHAQWDSRHADMAPGARLSTGFEPWLLREGYAEVVFDNGARLVVEAPAAFSILTGDQVMLDYGKLYVTVSEQAYGFTVCTPHSRIIDLGTEFGVLVGNQGDVEVHVLEGKVKLLSGIKGKINIDIFDGLARHLCALTGHVEERPLNPKIFARRINSDHEVVWRGQDRIELADVIGNGNGFGTGTANVSINPDNGQVSQGYIRHLDGKKGLAQYTVTNHLRFVDGVFVPDGSQSPTFVSSRGDIFRDSPETNGQYHSEISNGFLIADGQYRQMFQGVRYGTSENPSISMHANSGITFDLREMRGVLPGARLVAFESLYVPTGRAGVDVFVLIDGEVRFELENITAEDSAKRINIPLSDRDRFLTLVLTTDSDLWSRRGFFARPDIIIQ